MKEIIYGRNPVIEWLNAALPVNRIFIAKDTHGSAVQKVLTLASERHIPVLHVLRAKVDEITGEQYRHQGVAAEIKVPGYASIDDILKNSQRRGEPPLVAVLDSIQDPHNLGAILRSAEGAGIHGIIIPKDKAVGITPIVVKASAGAAAYLPVAQVTNLVRTMSELKDEGFWFVGVDQGGEKDYDQADFQGPMGLVFGSEGKGLRRLVRENCDFVVSIPMYGKVDSLNVSVAAALIFFEARRQREKKS